MELNEPGGILSQNGDGPAISPEGQLRDIESYLHFILDNSEDLIFTLDRDGRIVSYSKGGQNVFGYSPEQAIGSLIEEFASDREIFKKMLDISKAKGRVKDENLPFVHKEGHVVDCRVTMVKQVDSAGQCKGILGICRDESRWKRLKDNLVHVDRLAEMGCMASSVAHDINNPLAVINEIAGWARDFVNDAEGLNPDEKSELEKAVEDISAQTKRCSILTRQLLGFVREISPVEESFKVNTLLMEAVKTIDPELKSRNIRVLTDLQENLPPIRSDFGMLEQVIVNLLSNAMHAVNEKGNRGGTIELSATAEEPFLVIMVTDDGIGIPTHEQSRIFELFYSTKPKGKGTGLGLSICRNIIMKLGGSIRFESKPGEGTSFEVRLPVLEGPSPTGKLAGTEA